MEFFLGEYKRRPVIGASRGTEVAKSRKLDYLAERERRKVEKERLDATSIIKVVGTRTEAQVLHTSLSRTPFNLCHLLLLTLDDDNDDTYRGRLKMP